MVPFILSVMMALHPVPRPEGSGRNVACVGGGHYYNYSVVGSVPAACFLGNGGPNGNPAHGTVGGDVAAAAMAAAAR